LKQRMFAHRTREKGPHHWEHFGKTQFFVGLFGKAFPIVSVDVEISEEGQYMGWLDSEKNEFHHIYYDFRLVDMCFTNGSKSEADRGRGKVVKLKVTQVDA